MATPIKYQPDSRTHESPRDQLEELLEALAASGTLRVLKDLLQRIGPVAEVVSERLDTEPGRNALGNLALLASALARVSPDRLKWVVGTAVATIAHARRRPPASLHLLLSLRRENVRRTLFGLIAFFDALGAQLRPDDSQSVSQLRD
jgi:uncharacterized protein YjgD (DUF1641 family)